MNTNLKLLTLFFAFLWAANIPLIAHTTVALQNGENSVFSENNAYKQSIFESLQYEEVLNMEMEVDLDALINGEGKKKYQEAQLRYENAQGEEITWNIEVKQRGKSRRRLCDFPPLKLRFSKEDLAAQNLAPFHTLKLVTHCLDDAIISKENLLKEYLAYKIFNELTDKSLEVQLVKLTYRDLSRNGKKLKRWGFIIQNHDELANELAAEDCDCLNLGGDYLNRSQEALVSVFQYMIGNQDWSVRMARNVKTIRPKNGAPIILVPYDYDFSGFVDAAYAIPNPDLNVLSVKDRVYMGLKDNEMMIKTALDEVYMKKDKIYQVIKNCKALNSDARYELTDYLDAFFQNSDYETVIGIETLEAHDANNKTRSK